MLDSLLLPPPADATVARSHGTGSHGTGQHGTRAHGVRSRGASNGAQMVQRFAASEGIALHPAAVTLASGARVMVDGLDEDETLFVEAHAAPGPLTHLDLVRLTQDVFTLALLRHHRPEARAVVLLTDEAARVTLAARIADTPAAGHVELRVCP